MNTGSGSRQVNTGKVCRWLVTILGVCVLLRPSSLGLFAALLLSSVAYNVRKWPFVVNHILVESIINSVMLTAMVWSVWEDRSRRIAMDGAGFRETAVDRFAPVVRLMLVVMYYFAVVAKLNSDFTDPQYSCVTAMYDNLLRRFSFLPTGQWGELAAIWGTVAIELANSRTWYEQAGCVRKSGWARLAGSAYSSYAASVFAPVWRCSSPST